MTQITNNYSAYSPYVFKTLYKVHHHSVSSPSLLYGYGSNGTNLMLSDARLEPKHGYPGSCIWKEE